MMVNVAIDSTFICMYCITHVSYSRVYGTVVCYLCCIFDD